MSGIWEGQTKSFGKHEWMLFRIRVRVRVYEIRAEKTESEHPTTIWLNKENKKMPQLQFGTLCSLPFVRRNEYLCVCEWCLLSTLFGLVSEFKEVSLFPVLSLPVFFGLAFNRAVVHLLKNVLAEWMKRKFSWSINSLFPPSKNGSSPSKSRKSGV